jgi:hypothetical protein
MEQYISVSAASEKYMLPKYTLYQFISNNIVISDKSGAGILIYEPSLIALLDGMNDDC